MKKLLVILTVLAIAFTFVGCNTKDTTSTVREPVKINLPENSSVNGYRLPEESKAESAKEESTVSKDNSSVISSSSVPQNVQYCANINSKVFHYKDCSSVSSMKDENKYYLSDREALIADGYKPCSRCNP